MKLTKDLILPLVIAALLLFPAGLIVGRVTSDETVESSTESSEATDDETATEHSHGGEMQMVEAANAPAIANFEVTEDAKAGWNVTFEVQNFKFAPENASSPHVAGEGHAHIYVDGEKLSRLYGTAYYLGDLAEGDHEIRITLNSNDHKDYAVDGQVIDASASITDTHHADDSADHDDEDGHHDN